MDVSTKIFFKSPQSVLNILICCEIYTITCYFHKFVEYMGTRIGGGGGGGGGGG